MVRHMQLKSKFSCLAKIVLLALQTVGVVGLRRMHALCLRHATFVSKTNINSQNGSGHERMLKIVAACNEDEDVLNRQVGHGAQGP